MVVPRYIEHAPHNYQILSVECGAFSFAFLQENKTSRWTSYFIGGEERISAKASSVHLLKKMLRAFFRVIHYAEPSDFCFAKAEVQTPSRHSNKINAQMGIHFIGGEERIRTSGTLPHTTFRE